MRPPPWLVASRSGTTVAALLVRLAAGATFVGFSLGKFVRHDAEARAFDRYGLPAPDAFTYAVGVLELAGGLALILGLATRPAALLLAGNMVGAIATGGRVEGGPVHLGGFRLNCRHFIQVPGRAAAPSSLPRGAPFGLRGRFAGARSYGRMT